MATAIGITEILGSLSAVHGYDRARSKRIRRCLLSCSAAEMKRLRCTIGRHSQTQVAGHPPKVGRDPYLINILYDPRIRPGMTKGEVDALLPEIFETVRAWVAQAKPAKGDNPRDKLER